MKKLYVFIVIFVAMLGLYACGGGDSTDATTDKQVALVAITDGNNQTGPVGKELPNALVALIKNSAGQPIAGQTVNFKVVSGGGSVFAGAATSDASGYVRERWTLGTTLGTQKVEVRAVDSKGVGVVFTTFTATATADAPNSISILSGNNQSGIQLQPLHTPIVVIVNDTYGNPVPGASVKFTAFNGGSASPSTVTTDAGGKASATWTLAQSLGNQSIFATVVGVTPVKFVTFYATALQAPPSAPKAIIKYSGDAQTMEQYTLLPAQLMVKVTDVLGNGVPNVPVTFSAASGSGFVNALTVTDNCNKPGAFTSVITDNYGIARWYNFIRSTGIQTIDATVVGLTKVSFTINVTASTHIYDGLYSCGLFINGGHISACKFEGLVNESTGQISYDDGYKMCGGNLTIDSLQQVTGTVTCYPEPSTTFNCSRL